MPVEVAAVPVFYGEFVSAGMLRIGVVDRAVPEGYADLAHSEFHLGFLQHVGHDAPPLSSGRRFLVVNLRAQALHFLSLTFP